MTTPLPAIDYSSRDFLGIQASLYTRAAQVVPDWTSRDAGDFGVLMVDLLAYLGDILSYQIDRVAAETFLTTARRRESVVNIATLMGYKPVGRLAAKVTLQFTAPDTSTATVPAGTQVTTAPTTADAPLYFETTESITFPSGGTAGAPQNKTVEAIEGRTISSEAVAISTGESSQFYALYRQPVIDGSVVIQVQDDPAMPIRSWGYVDNIIEAGPGDEVFTVDVDENGIVSVIFGNGITGKIPTRGAQITASYRIGGGVIGNVAPQTVNQLVTTIANVTSVTNITPGRGGQDEEDIEVIRAKAPYVFAANNRAVNEEDWTGLALRVPQVTKAKAVAHVYNQPVIYIAPGDGSAASDELLERVVSFIQPRSIAGSVVRAASATYRAIDVVATVRVFPQYSRESVRQVVLTELGNLFAFNNPEGVADFGALVSQAAVYSTIVNVPGVKSCVLSVLANADGSGVADIQTGPEEIPQLGDVEIAATGGITPFSNTIEVIGGNPTSPTPAGAPSVSLARCDAGSTHLELIWAAGSNTTLWYLEVAWLDGVGTSLHGPQNFGPASTTNMNIDIPKHTDAVSLRLRMVAYNGTTGPVYSPATSIANPCY